MINSRNIDDLIPEVAAKCRALIAECAKVNIDLLVTSTYRDNESQTVLFNQGRSAASKAKGEKIVTNAAAGSSFHNYRVAFDVVPIIAGKAVWSEPKLWGTIGKLGKSVGLEWAGDWKSFKETAHFQEPGLTIAKLKGSK